MRVRTRWKRVPRTTYTVRDSTRCSPSASTPPLLVATRPLPRLPRQSTLALCATLPHQLNSLSHRPSMLIRRSRPSWNVKTEPPWLEAPRQSRTSTSAPRPAIDGGERLKRGSVAVAHAVRGRDVLAVRQAQSNRAGARAAPRGQQESAGDRRLRPVANGDQLGATVSVDVSPQLRTRGRQRCNGAGARASRCDEEDDRSHQRRKRVARAGIEPATPRFSAVCSTN